MTTFKLNHIHCKTIYLQMELTREVQQQIAHQDYFVPPPFNDLNNRTYTQQIDDAVSNIRNLTNTYSCFGQILPFNNNTIQQINQLQITPQIRQQLKNMNINIYLNMIKCLENIGGENPALATSDHANIKSQVCQMIQICERIKLFYVRQQVYEMMKKETGVIRRRTQAIKKELEGVKKELKDVVAEEQTAKMDVE